MTKYSEIDRGMETASVLQQVQKGVPLAKGYQSMAYIGLDVHKDSIAVAIAWSGREEPEYRGEILNTPKAIEKLIRRLSPDGELLAFCYEAGPCGYVVYRQISRSC